MSANNNQGFLSNPELKKEEEIKYAEEAPELNILNELAISLKSILGLYQGVRM